MRYAESWTNGNVSDVADDLMREPRSLLLRVANNLAPQDVATLARMLSAHEGRKGAKK
jgi:hypothetical protein